jgi:hypothetical protein
MEPIGRHAVKLSTGRDRTKKSETYTDSVLKQDTRAREERRHPVLARRHGIQGVSRQEDRVISLHDSEF